MLIATFWGLATAALLLSAGYLFGLKKGNQARQRLRQTVSEQKELKIDALLQQGSALQRVLEPLAEWDTQIEKIRTDIKQMHASVLQRDQAALELTNLETSTTQRSNLARLLGEIAEKARFESVLLCDENGLPLASSENAEDLDRLAAIASFAVIFGDRISRDNETSPVSFLVRDSRNSDTLSRIFYVGNTRLVLTAVAVDLQLTPGALDPALEKVIKLLE